MYQTVAMMLASLSDELVKLALAVRVILYRKHGIDSSSAHLRMCRGPCGWGGQ